ncbi:hypothetical protein BJF81_15690 [Ornithinimicrobium sp. CNJ-824]|nr:hypothetical protein BJF81_15690 [Ornithinimicrobium sp. CNJ-824]
MMHFRIFASGAVATYLAVIADTRLAHPSTSSQPSWAVAVLVLYLMASGGALAVLSRTEGSPPVGALPPAPVTAAPLSDRGVPVASLTALLRPLVLAVAATACQRRLKTRQ